MKIYEKTWFQTYTGGRFDFINLRDNIYSIEDISQSTSQQCRFGGHIKFYSVAQHCVDMARWFRKQGMIEEAKWALLHDGAEAYVLDLMRPLKYLLSMKKYKQTERRIQQVVFESFGLFGSAPSIVKEIDYRAVYFEASQLYPKLRSDWLDGVDVVKATTPIPDYIIKPYKTMAIAKREYKKEYRLLFKKGL